MKFADGECESKDGIHVKLTEFLLANTSLKHLNLEVFAQLSSFVSFKDNKQINSNRTQWAFLDCCTWETSKALRLKYWKFR